MKRLTSSLLAVFFAALLLAGAAADGVTFQTAYFTMTLPEGWQTDTEAEKDAQEGTDSLGSFAEPEDIGLVAGAWLMYYDELKNVSLWEYDEAELDDYAQELMESFAEDNPEYLGIVMAENVPFVVFRGTDEDGEYLYADTMTNGYAIVFTAFVSDMEGEKQYPISDEDTDQFLSILETFRPVT
ncbi:MAG: hypothetical protein K5922_01675 [Clostridiales bacterium]|nr:hypothetical protein [Clostridiales bacterium]